MDILRGERAKLRCGVFKRVSYGALSVEVVTPKQNARRRQKDIHLSALTDLEFKRWATENKLSKHTRHMLELEHFDSMKTLKMLRPDMIDLLNLNPDENDRLFKALGKLHMNSRGSQPDLTMDSGYTDGSSDTGSEESDIPRMSPLKHRRSLPMIFNGNFLPSRHLSFKKGELPLLNHDESPVSFYINTNDDNQSIVTTESERLHSLREEDLRDLLDYMVLEEITTREIQEEILAKNSFRKKVQRLQNIMVEAGEQTRMNLEKVMRSNYHAALPAISLNMESNSCLKNSELSNNWKMVGRQGSKRVSWETDSSNSSNSNNNNIELTSTGKKIPLDPEIFVIKVGNKNKGHVNPYFENDNGDLDLPKSPILKFGHKGRQDGELQDATSIIALDNSEIIVTDQVKSKLQIFDSFGAPVKTMRVLKKYQPWNLALSPHGWLAVTFRSSKSLCILDKNGEEIASLGGEIYKDPTGLAVDHNGRYIVTDATTNSVHVHVYHPKAERFVTHSLNPDVKFHQPRYVTVSNSGDIIISDTGNHCVKIFSPDGELLCEFGSYGQKPGNFRFPYGVCVDVEGNILVADHYNNRVAMFDQDGGFLRNLITEVDGLMRPQGLHISVDQKLYITHGRMKASEILVFDLTPQDSNIHENTYL